jgi:hypothetical protein
MAAAKKSASSAKRVMSDAHKQALADGRAQGRAVRAYLDALESHKPKRGRKRTPDSIGRQLARIDDELLRADPMKRLALVQERLDLQRELEGFDTTVDLAALEADFIEHAWYYSQSKGITRAAWREVGVPASVLRAAGF